MQVDELTSAFGSNKKRKAMASRKKNELKSSVLESAIGTAVNSSSMSVEDLERNGELKETLYRPYSLLQSLSCISLSTFVNSLL